MHKAKQRLKDFPSKLRNRFTRKSENEESDNQIFSDKLLQYYSFFKVVSAWYDSSITADELRTACYEYSLKTVWVKKLVIEEGKKEFSNTLKTLDEQTLWNEYLFSLKLSEVNITQCKSFNWKVVGKIICARYSINMHILNIDNSQGDVDWLTESITKITYDQTVKSKTIHIINIQNEGFVLENEDHCCAVQDTPPSGKATLSSVEKQTVSNSDKMESLLVEFVSTFVKEFEAKLALYVMIAEGEVKKAGKFSDSYAERLGQISGGVIGGTIGFAVGLPGAGSQLGVVIGGKVFKEIGSKLGSDHHALKVANLTQLIETFENDPHNLHQMLVEVGIEIFQSFEMQFGRVTSVLGGQKRAMHLLARDAMNRAIQYISKCPAKATTDLKLLILEGVRLGESKVEAKLNIPIPTRNEKRLGFAIKYVYQDFSSNWRTSSLFSKVGLVIIDGTGRKYYKLLNGKCDSNKYGFRRCFVFEKWERISLNYIEIDLVNQSDQFLNYSFTFEPNKLQPTHNLNLREKIERTFTNENLLEADRIKELINETRGEILGELEILKTISDIIDSDSKILINIETNLNNLKIDEYFKILQAGNSKILFEVRENRKIIEQVCEKIDAVVTNMSSKNHIKKKSKITPSIWFDVKEPLKTFSGRVEHMKHIENELENGIVVIYGLGGVGKSELLIKYARDRFTANDNVIWINAESPETIVDCCFRLAQTLHLCTIDEDGRTKHINLIVSSIYEKISQRKTLIIIDNAENLTSVEMLLTPNSHFKTFKPQFVITSVQNCGWESVRLTIKTIQLTAFNHLEATEFLKASLSNQHFVMEDIDKLIDFLDGFPLALQQAVSYIKRSNEICKKRNLKFTLSSYLKLFEKDSKTLLNFKLPNDVHSSCKSIITVMQLTLKKLESEEEGALALLILKLCSFLAPNNIPENLFLGMSEHLPLDLINTADLLESYSMVNAQNKALNIHNLIQVTIRSQLNEEEELEVLDKVLELIVKQLTKKEQTINYAPHVVSIWKFAYKHESLIKKFIVDSFGNKSVYSPFLHFLVESEKIKIVKEIIDKIKSIDSEQLVNILNEKNKINQFPIEFAVKNIQMTQLLIENGSTIHLKTRFDWTLLHFAAKFDQSEVVQLLIEKEHEIDVLTLFKFTALHFCVNNGNSQLAKYLIENGANVNATNKSNFTPLHLAVKGNYIQVVEMLLESEKIIIDAETEFKLTPLHFACRLGYLDIAKLLISYGANYNAKNKAFCTPLHYAVLDNRIEIVDLLINCEKIDINAQTLKGNTALHLAAEKKNLEIVKLLISKELNVDIKNNNDNTAFDLADEKIRNYLFQFN